MVTVEFVLKSVAALMLEDARIVPVVRPEDALIEPQLTDVPTMFDSVATEPYNPPELMLVVASRVPVVIPVDAIALVKFKVPVLAAVATKLVIVLLLVLTLAANTVPVVIDPDNAKLPPVYVCALIVPVVTSNANAGEVVPMPTFPAVVIRIRSTLLKPSPYLKIVFLPY